MNSNLLISLELVCLMEWLLKKEKKQLDLLIDKAIAEGLVEEIDNVSDNDIEKISKNLCHKIIDFLIQIENMLLKKLEISDENELKQLENINQEALNKIIYQGSIDLTTIKKSIKAAHKDFGMSKHNSQEQTSIFLKKLLENWNPSKKENIN